jgi:predicted DNA-binding transcriptional regulator YafY
MALSCGLLFFHRLLLVKNLIITQIGSELSKGIEMSTTNYKTVLRHILMLSMIPREPLSIPTEKLYEKINEQGYPVSLRTVQRDLKEYNNVPFLKIRFKKEEEIKDRLWYIERDADMFNIPRMSNLSALSFNLIEKFLQTKLPIAIQDQLKPFFSSARNRLNLLGSSSWVNWSEKIRILPRGHRLIPAEVKHEAIDVIFDALWREKQFEAYYTKRGESKEVEYRVHPLGLVFREEAVYLICTLWDYDDVVQLALHRFQTVSPLNIDSCIPKGFHLDDYISDKNFSYLENVDEIKLKILLDAGAAIHLHESQLSEDQHLEEQPDGKIVLEATIKDTSELRWWLLGFGEYVEVLEPRYLRNVFMERSANMASLYKK